MATKVASLFGVLGMDDSSFRDSASNAKTTMSGLGDQMTKIGGQVTSFGASVTTIFAPIAAAVGVATNMAIGFDEAMTNIQAVTGRSSGEMASLRDEVMRLGASSRFGPQAAAEAFYDIVGGVSDASTQMAIFKTAISTAQAGNADLGSTTKALISVMNSYKFGADQAGFASDVLTQTVGKGVGTMNEFASALPQVTGLANSLGIGFDDLAGNAAYLTTQGNTASQATTQLAAMMTAMLNPNETMKKGLNELGYSSGQAAVEALGLTGAYEALAGTHTANTEGMAKMLGSVEALRGATALAGPDVTQFMTDFTGGLQGVTQAAEQVQMSSAAAQVDLLKSSVSELGIEVGTAMIPALKDLVKEVGPVITNVISWVKQNPELIKQIGTIAVIATGAGVAITGAGTAISAVGNIVKAATSPWGALLLAITAVIAAYKEWQSFQGMTGASREAARQQIAPMVASGQVSMDQLKAQVFASTQAQFGGGFFGDALARLVATPLFIDTAAANLAAQGPSHAGGLESVPYDNYLANLHKGEGVLTEAQNRNRGGDTIQIYVSANSYEGGRAAGNGAMDAIMERRRSRG